jgi:hypothetical protein
VTISAATEGRVERPAYIISLDHQGIAVGWDTCGLCMLHIRLCECTDGPREPTYIAKLRTEGSAPTSYGPRTDDESSDPDAPRRTVIEHPKTVERHPITGRKVRSDKGKARKRSEPTAEQVEAVADSAASLAEAMQETT